MCRYCLDYDALTLITIAFFASFVLLGWLVTQARRRGRPVWYSVAIFVLSIVLSAIISDWFNLRIIGAAIVTLITVGTAVVVLRYDMIRLR